MTIVPALNRDQAMAVLRAVEHNHDADRGVTWYDLRFWADELYPNAAPDGYTKVETGGGCEAWRRDLPDGSFILITDDSGIGVYGAENWLVGRHNEAGDFIACEEVVTLDRALELADQIPDPTGQQRDDWRPE